jgi:hypothetical protein
MVADLLAKGFRRRSRQYWLQGLERLAKHPTPTGRPKYGLLLEADGSIVGVILLIFTTIDIGTERVTRCNVSSWYVEPAYRSHATLFISQAVKREQDVTYLNISPARHVQPIIEAQGFLRYSQGQFLALPVLSGGSNRANVRVFNANKCPDVNFEPFERDLLLSHIEYGCVGAWCATSQFAYPFVFLPRVIKGILPCAQLIYCRHVDDLVRFARPIGWFLTFHGLPLLLLDSNGPIPGLVGKYFDGAAPKYFRGPHRPRLGDLAYTEAAIFGL